MVDLLAIAAHRDDVELTCGGTLAKAAKAGHRVGIVDLTQGEMGTRGSAEIRARRRPRSGAKSSGVAMRENLGLPDAAIVNDPPTREKLARVIRRLQPRVVIAPAREGRHPDHVATAQLVRDASFLAGLAKLAPDVPKHRPRKDAPLHLVPAGLRAPVVRRRRERRVRAQARRRSAATSRSSRGSRRRAKSTRTASRSRTSCATTAHTTERSFAPLRRAVPHHRDDGGRRRAGARGVDLLSDDAADLRLVPRARRAARAAAPALRAGAFGRAAVHRRAPVERALVQGHPPRPRRAHRRVRRARSGSGALAIAAHQHADAHRRGAAHRRSRRCRRSTSRSSAATSAARAARRASSSARSKSHGSETIIEGAAFRSGCSTHQDTFSSRANDSRPVPRPGADGVVFPGRSAARVRAVVRAVAVHARPSRRARHRPVDGGTGGSLGARYLRNNIEERFFPRLWAVRGKFFGKK